MVGNRDNPNEEELYTRMAENDANIYVTLMNNGSTVPLESFELGVPCIIAAFVSWVICRNPHPEYTIVWCAFPLFVLDLYHNWLKENGVIE